MSLIRSTGGSYGIVQTNIGTAFRETVGRVRQERIGGFDVLRTTLIGNVFSVDQWTPAPGSNSTAIGLPYPNMLLTSCSQPEEEGAMCRIECTYTGFLGINGYTPKPVLTISSTETSATLQVPATQPVTQGVASIVGVFVNGKYADLPPGTILNLFSFGTSETLQYVWGRNGAITRYGFCPVTTNYISQSVHYAWQQLTQPIVPLPYQGGASYSVISTIVGECSGIEITLNNGQVPAGTALPIIPTLLGGQTFQDRYSIAGNPPKPVVICTSWTAQQIVGTYFDCQATYEYKYIDASHVT